MIILLDFEYIFPSFFEMTQQIVLQKVVIIKRNTAEIAEIYIQGSEKRKYLHWEYSLMRIYFIFERESVMDKKRKQEN